MWLAIMDSGRDTMPGKPVEVSEADELPFLVVERIDGELNGELCLGEPLQLLAVELTERLEDVLALVLALKRADPLLDLPVFVFDLSVASQLFFGHWRVPPLGFCRSARKADELGLDLGDGAVLVLDQGKGLADHIGEAVAWDDTALAEFADKPRPLLGRYKGVDP